MTFPAAPSAGVGWVSPTPTHPIASPPPPSRRQTPRRTGLAVGLVAAGVGLLVLAVTTALLIVHVFTQPQILTSANGVVTLQVPGSWDDSPPSTRVSPPRAPTRRTSG